MSELTELKQKYEADLKVLLEKHQGDVQTLQQQASSVSVAQVVVAAPIATATNSVLTSGEKKELMDALELLKSENQNLASKVGGSAQGPMSQQKVFQSLMRALDRAKHII